MSARMPELAALVEAAVLATPGVRGVYRSGSIVANIVGTGAEALGFRPDDEPVVTVSLAESEVTVAASIGVDDTGAAASTLEAVRGAVERALAVVGLSVGSIVVTVAHVHPREAGVETALTEQG